MLLQLGVPHRSPARQHRAANRRYQQSPEGRLDHRDRQQHYRERRRRPRVTDESSLSVISPAPCGYGETITTPAAGALRFQSPGRLDKRVGLWLRCSICGRQATSSILFHTFHDEGELP